MRYSPRYLPRKGTETQEQQQLQSKHSKHSPRYLPRKGTETYNPLTFKFFEKIRHDIYPARGRKLTCWVAMYFWTINSPRYLPRKGTETFVFGADYGVG